MHSSASARLRGAAALLVALALAPAPAPAHLGDLSYSEVVVRGAEVDYKLKFAAHLIPGSDPAGNGKITRQEVAAREGDIIEWLGETLEVQLDGERCTPSLVDSIGPDNNDDLTVVLAFACARAGKRLRIEFRAFDRALPAFQNIASVEHAGRSVAFVFTPESRILSLGDDGIAESESGRTSLGDFFVLGVEHIWTGYDHLLFLLALLLPGGTIARLTGIVTAFTVAHSITLALAALDMVTLPSAPVEAAIAASVVFAALDGLRPHAHDHRPALTFAFGLVHGFGFAGVLREAGLPSGAVALPLLGFNLGVEAGQIAVVLVVVPLTRALARSPRGRSTKRGLAWSIAAVGCFWLAARLSAWLA